MFFDLIHVILLIICSGVITVCAIKRCSMLLIILSVYQILLNIQWWYSGRGYAVPFEQTKWLIWTGIIFVYFLLFTIKKNKINSKVLYGTVIILVFPWVIPKTLVVSQYWSLLNILLFVIVLIASFKSDHIKSLLNILVMIVGFIFVLNEPIWIFIDATELSGIDSFMFGWHAIQTVIPIVLLYCTYKIGKKKK
ncbi:hypothetical protein [Cysteiniphilum litorale]|uniref:hypothetical protein n=1 Tax=Cysteiniphilum litorale TaxID=2056700 RepID=UPI003F884940